MMVHADVLGDTADHIDLSIFFPLMEQIPSFCDKNIEMKVMEGFDVENTVLSCSHPSSSV